MSVREVRKPKLNEAATTLEEMIDWENAHKPVLSCNLSSDKVEEFIATPMIVPVYPAHTQGSRACGEGGDGRLRSGVRI